MSQFYNDSIFWIEVDKIQPNPYQPRKEFDQMALKSLSDSIRHYGVLQALVVTRNEVEKPEGGLEVRYELIAGERRLRASRLAGLTQVPCLIKTGAENNQMKLELAIIENLQREDINPVERAKAFKQLTDEFSMTHAKVAEKVGKSREYVSNTLRLLNLPLEMLDALAEGKISEGHARPLLMLTDKPEEQQTVFKEILYRRLTVREAEQVSRKIAVDKVRKHDFGVDPKILDFENQFSESLGTRVHIEKKDQGGKILIDFFSDEDLNALLDIMKNSEGRGKNDMVNKFLEKKQSDEQKVAATHSDIPEQVISQATPLDVHEVQNDKPLSMNVATPPAYKETPAQEQVAHTGVTNTPVSSYQPSSQNAFDVKNPVVGEGTSQNNTMAYGGEVTQEFQTKPVQENQNREEEPPKKQDDDVFGMDSFTI